MIDVRIKTPQEHIARTESVGTQPIEDLAHETLLDSNMNTTSFFHSSFHGIELDFDANL